MKELQSIMFIIRKKNVYEQYCFLLSNICFLLFVGCAKEKMDFTYDNRKEDIVKSAVRIINLGDYKHVIIDQDTLTNKSEKSLYGSVPTKDFNDYLNYGYLTDQWTLPARLFEKNENLKMELINDSMQSLHFTIPNSANKAIDYYTIRSEGAGQPWVVPITRDQTSAIKKDHFKIRIINLAKYQLPNLIYPSHFGGGIEDLYGPISLTYADGTPVSPKTSNIGVNQRVSEYIELPYGTYQFRLLAWNGRQLSAAQQGVNAQLFDRKFDPATSRMVFRDDSRNPQEQLSNNTFAPMQSYVPGGVYTIVLAPREFNYFFYFFDFKAVQNQFHILADHELPVNKGYVNVQAINTTDESVNFHIQGKLHGDPLDFGGFTRTQSITYQDSILCEVFDSKGKLLTKKRVFTLPNQHIALWCWQDAEGHYKLKSINNQLAKDLELPKEGDNGVFNRFEMIHYTAIRFLNFCADEPLINFGINNGQSIPVINKYLAPPINPNAYLNKRPGEIESFNPYLYWDPTFAQTGTFEFLTYRSINDIVPGSWISDIPPLSSSVFVADPTLYTRVGQDIPTYESGVYSIALIGRTTPGAKNKARLICIKHTR